MGPLDILWHLSNFLVIPLAMGGLAAALVRATWRQELRPQRWRDLAPWAAGACALVQTAGLVLQGRDGRMGTYAAMVLACAAALWWRAWGRRRPKGGRPAEGSGGRVSRAPRV